MNKLLMFLANVVFVFGSFAMLLILFFHSPMTERDWKTVFFLAWITILMHITERVGIK